MTVELRKNGRLSILITPTDGIETVILDSMAASAERGQPVKLEKRDGAIVFSMEAD
jgi:hypothetical protein